jgi:hypothetical protein
MAGTEHPGRPRCRVRSARYLAYYILCRVFADLQLSCSRLPPSPDYSDRALWLGCEGIHRHPCATASTGHRSGASVANVFNPLKTSSERVAPDTRIIGRLDLLSHSFAVVGVIGLDEHFNCGVESLSSSMGSLGAPTQALESNWFNSSS